MKDFTLSTFVLLLLGTALSCTNKQSKINDEFRTDVVSKLQVGADTLQAYNAFLDQLDKKNIAFGNYYKKSHGEIQDSLHEIITADWKNSEYLYNELTPEQIENLYQMTLKALRDYDRSLGLDSTKSTMIEWTTNSSVEIKRYLNARYGLQLFIPEDEPQDAVSE